MITRGLSTALAAAVAVGATAVAAPALAGASTPAPATATVPAAPGAAAAAGPATPTAPPSAAPDRPAGQPAARPLATGSRSARRSERPRPVGHPRQGRHLRDAPGHPPPGDRHLGGLGDGQGTDGYTATFTLAGSAKLRIRAVGKGVAGSARDVHPVTVSSSSAPARAGRWPPTCSTRTRRQGSSGIAVGAAGRATTS